LSTALIMKTQEQLVIREVYTHCDQMCADRLDNFPLKCKRSPNFRDIVRGLFDDHNSKRKVKTEKK